MKKVYPIVIYTIIALMAGSCQKNIDEFTPYPGITLKQRVLIVVQDEDKSPIGGVNVLWDKISYTTDGNGLIYLPEVTVEKGRSHISFTKDGYFRHDISIGFQKQDDVRTIRVVMHRKEMQGVFNANEKQSFKIGDLSLRVPAEAFESEEQKIYQGNYTVYVNQIPTTGKALYRSYLGYGGGKRKNGSKVSLENFGQFQIIVSNNQGKALSLRDGKVIEVKFNPNPTLLAELQNTSSMLWKIDVKSGIWKEYTTCQFNGENFSFTLSDLGSFMIADAFPTVVISGRIAMSDGTLLAAGYLDFINIAGTCHSIPLAIDGTFQALLPQNESFTVKLYNTCGELLGSTEIGPYPVKTDIGVLEFPSLAEYIIRLRTTDCFNNPVDGAYFSLGIGRTFYMPMSSELNIQWHACEPLINSEEQISYINPNGQRESILIDEQFRGNYGKMNACNKVFDRSWNMYINGKALEVVDLKFSSEENRLILEGNLPEGSIKISFNTETKEMHQTYSQPDIDEVIKSTYLLHELDAGGMKISYEIHYRDSSGKEGFIYGRILWGED